MVHDAQDLALDLVIGVDLGGTKTAASAVDSAGVIYATASAPTPAREGADEVVATVVSLVARLRDELPGRVGAIGIGSAGIVDPVSGVILGATDAIRGWAGTQLAERVREATDLPTRVINDVHAHALGEHFLGGFAEDADVLLVAVGTGIGGSMLVGGRPIIGAKAAAGHVGHVASPYAADIACSCGGRGHVEVIGSGPAILATYRRLGGAAADTREVVALASAGDASADAAIALSAKAVGSLVGGLVNTFDPDAVVVSGGVPNIGERWWERFAASVDAELLPVVRGTSLHRSVSRDAACVGATRLWFVEAKEPLHEA